MTHFDERMVIEYLMQNGYMAQQNSGKQIQTAYAEVRERWGVTAADYAMTIMAMHENFRKNIILLVHGIRTNAEWQELVASQMSTLKHTSVKPIRYEFFDAIRFLLPFTRNRPIQRVLSEYRAVRHDYPSANVSVIAHSFGTYICAQILSKNHDVQFHRLLLCGSVISPRYDWHAVRSRVTESIICECGSKDHWPVLAKVFGFGYGPSGTFGFGSTAVRDRFHDLAHSGYFTQEFVSEYWMPFLTTGEIRSTQWESNRPAVSYCLSILSLLSPTILLVLASLIAVLIGWLMWK